MSQKLPDPFLILDESNKNTPDWSDLKSSVKDEFCFLITGSMRKGKENNKYLNGCNYYGTGVTWGTNFIMNRPNYQTKDNTPPDPLVFKFDSDKTNWKEVGEYFDPNEMKAIEGDVYGVPLRKLARLDIQEGNTDGIIRDEVHVVMLSPIQNRHSMRMFLYTVDLPFYMQSFSPHTPLEKCNTIEYMGDSSWKGVEAYRA